MKNILVIPMMVVSILILCSCGKRVESTSKQESSKQSENVSESKSLLADSVESAPRSEPAQVKRMIEQPDPTLPENMTVNFYTWHNDEYLIFGNSKDYINFSGKLPNVEQTQKVNFSVKLPLCITATTTDMTIELGYDGKFKNGVMPIGVISGYFVTKPGETITQNASWPIKDFSQNPFSGEKYNVRESDENSVGAFVQCDKYVRCVTQYIGPKDNNNNTLNYVCWIADDKLVHVRFDIAAEATSEDLKLYDAIIKSIAVT